MPKLTATIFDYRIDAQRAKSLLLAMRKGTWDKLTPAQKDAVEDFISTLR